MKKGFLGLLIFFFNVMPIYALSFKMEPSITSRNVEVGEIVDIDVYLNDISDTQSGISACTLKISSDDGILVNENIKTYGNWQGINGSKGYSFDTIDSVLSNTKFFTFSVTVNKAGNVRLTDIVCTDTDDVQNTVIDKAITFTIGSQASSSSSNPSSSNKPNSSASSGKPASSSSSKPAASSSSKPASSSQPASSSSNPSSSSMPNSSASSGNSQTDNNKTDVYLSDIIMSGGVINFSKDVFEYNIQVDDIELVSVTPVVENGMNYDISESFEDGLKNYLITVWNKNGDSIKYIIYLSENLQNPSYSSSYLNDVSTNDNNYTGIFIAIIVILVLINIGRIGYNFYVTKKK